MIRSVTGPGRDRTDYKSQRREAAKKASQAAQDQDDDGGMFFGTSPTEKKELRETVDKRGIDIDKLNLNALDRDRYNAPEKIGKTMRLIDMALADSDTFKPNLDKQKQATQPPRPPKGARPPGRKPKPKPRPKPRPPAQAKPKPKPKPKPKRVMPPLPKPTPPRPAAKKKKPAKTGKGVRISDLGLTEQPRKIAKRKKPRRRPR